MFIRREMVKQIRKNLEAGNLIGVSTLKAGVRSSNTRDQWKNKSNCNRLGRLIEGAKQRGQDLRDDAVEDAQYKRLIEGRAAGTEYQFYLTNRRTARWKKLTEFGSTQGAPVLLKPPVINYISVSVNKESSGTGYKGEDAVVVTAAGRISSES